jgi:hypothetical protein
MQKSHAADFAVSNLKALEKQVQSCMEYIPFVEDNEKVISPKFIPIILDVCSLIDSIFHQISTEPVKRFNLKKYSEMYEPQLELESNISLFLATPVRALIPFAGWTKRPPKWWAAYNVLKHDRLKNYGAATFENAVMGFVALHQVMVRLKEFVGPFLREGWIDTSDIEIVADLSSAAHLGALHRNPPRDASGNKVFGRFLNHKPFVFDARISQKALSGWASSLVVESQLVVSPTIENFVRSFDGLYFDIDYDVKGISNRVRNLLFAHEEW